MKDIKKYVSLETQNNIVDHFCNLGYEPLYIEGCLNDTYVFHLAEEDMKKYKIGNMKLRKYLILGHEYANSWGNKLFLFMTDKEATYEAYEKMYQDNLEDEEEYINIVI